MVASHNPSFVITTGDNYYTEAGGTGLGMYNQSAGAYYGWWMKDAATGPGNSAPSAAINSFFPSLGNHDYSAAKPAPGTYLAYFDLPGSGFTNTSGNERYYDFVQGPVHFFVLNSNAEEPDGTSPGSKQGHWLQEQLAASTAPWNIVYFHHAPYSSDGVHGPDLEMQWPFAAWGADAVIAGHGHIYERILRDGIVYFVNGLGGGPIHPLAPPVAGSQSRYNFDWGAQIVKATDTTLDFTFYGSFGEVVDTYITSVAGPPAN
jgi:tartrate-resistant acid phosphatase type 5